MIRRVAMTPTYASKAAGWLSSDWSTWYPTVAYVTTQIKTELQINYIDQFVFWAVLFDAIFIRHAPSSTSNLSTAHDLSIFDSDDSKTRDYILTVIVRSH